MFVRVDCSSDEALEGFSYLNKGGDEESVELCKADGMIVINDDVRGRVHIFKEDIANMIKCLQMADQWFKENTSSKENT